MKEFLTCPYCKEKHEVETYEIIDVSKNKDLKDKVLNNTIFLNTCPKCNKEYEYIYPFFYKDSEKKFIVQYDRLSAIFNTYENMEKEKGVIKTSATTFSNLINKIILLENGYDHRIGEIYLLLMEKELKKDLAESNNYKNIKINDSHFAYVDGKVTLVINFENMDNNQKGYTTKPFSTQLYDSIYNMYIKALNGIFDYHFDFDSAIKFVLTFNNKKIDIAKKHYCQLAVISFNENNQAFALVPDFNKDKFKPNQTVVVSHNNALAKVFINNIIDFSLFDCPNDITRMPLLLYRPTQVSYKTDDDVSNIKNIDAIGMILKKELDESIIKNAKVIIGVNSKVVPTSELKQLINENNFEKANEYIEANKDHLKFISEFYKESNNSVPFVVATLDENDLALKQCDAKVAISFESLIDLTLNDINNNYGIRFNISSNQFFDILAPRLLKYKADCIMNHDQTIKEVLSKLTDEEKAYIGSMSLSCINDIYFNEKSPDSIAECLHINKKEVLQYLKEGYDALAVVIKSNYLF